MEARAILRVEPTNAAALAVVKRDRQYKLKDLFVQGSQRGGAKVIMEQNRAKLVQQVADDRHYLESRKENR